MKWFSGKPLPRDRGKLIDVCVEYLSRQGELPERDATFKLLLETIKLVTVSRVTYKKILALGNERLNHWLAMFGPELVLDILVDCDIISESMVANALRNKALTAAHVEKLNKRKRAGTGKDKANDEIIRRKQV